MSSIRPRAVVPALLFFITLSFATLASAHHSTAIYDSEHPVELAGTVVEWKFTNPHCIIVLDVTAADGSVQRWNIEGGNTSGLFRSGWTPATLQPGDQILVTVRPLRSGAFGGNFSNPRRANGEPVVAVPAGR
ncbi:MAG: hypothetical protein RLZZ227_1859 [Pseudomonadota bacterium]|jgi:hypothetical protein